MKHKKLILFLVSLIFFLTALTFYLNRIVFPQMVKKIVVERLEETLHRQVEIGSLHFSWVKGFIIDGIKLHEKSSPTAIFAQAQQVTFGVLIFPGIKHFRITIPFIHINSPSIHLIREEKNTWNFSDMIASSAPSSSSASPISTKSQNFEIAWGGLTITDGKVLIDDNSQNPRWSEYFNNINLKLSLSYQGINYDFTADIPQKNGFIGATVYYQPITKDSRAHIHLRNIDTASYLSLIDIPEINLKSGIIEDIDLDMEHTLNKTSAKGNVLIKKLDISNSQQSFKGDIEIHGLDARYEDGDIYAQGQMTLAHIKTTVPGLSSSGNIKTRVDRFEYTKDGVDFTGSLQVQDGSIDLKDRHIQAQQLDAENIQVLKDHNGIQSIGSMTVQGLAVQWPNQKLQGDFKLQDLHLSMKDENNIHVTGSFQADSFFTNLGDKTIHAHELQFKDAQLDILNEQNILLNTTLTLNQTQLILGDNFELNTTAQSNKLNLKLDNGNINLSTVLNTSDTKLVLNNKIISGSPQLELNLKMPLNDPSQMIYNGSITLSDGSVQGFSPIDLDHIELDADFDNNQATINSLSTSILDTKIRVNGTVQNFVDPNLDILAEADDLNLAKLKEIFPQIVNQLGLTFKGSSFVKVKFQGKSKDPLSGNILAVASFKNVSIQSSKLNQHLDNITGILEATPNSLKWRDTTATWMGQPYNLAGQLHDFKNPQITFTVDGPKLVLKVDLSKNNNLIRIDDLSGRFYDTAINAQGSIALTPGEAPYLDLKTNASLLLENLVKVLPASQQQYLLPLNPTGYVDMSAEIKGSASNWKYYAIDANITSDVVTLKGYSLKNIKITVNQKNGKIKQLLADANLYDGTLHAVGSMDLIAAGMPYELALNIDGTDLHKLKMDTPFKMQEINGKFYFTTLAHGTVADFKNNLQATGSMAIRDGFLGEFNLFKGLLSILNNVMQLTQVMITDVEGSFTIANQRISTDNLRLKGPTIVLLTKGWVDFDQICDLNVTVDLSSGVMPGIAHDVLNTLNIHIYDKISDPKFKKKISVPQVINSLLKNLWQ